MKRVLMAAALSLVSFCATADDETGGPMGPAWVQKSNANAHVLLSVIGRFDPENASSLGLADYDTQATDLLPDRGKRLRAALSQARDDLAQRLDNEPDDEPVRQDLQILIDAADQQIRGSQLQEQYLMTWIDVPQLVFEGLRSLLEEQMPAERRAHAVDRLQRYAGLAPGTRPLTQLAQDRYNDDLSRPGLLYPTKLELDRALGNTAIYAKGIREAFAAAKLQGAGPGIKALEKQFDDYQRWTRKVVLPKARADFRLPEELYAFQLRTMGIDVTPQLLMQRAQVEYAETRAAMQALAPQIAKARGESADDYRSVIRSLKKKQMENAAIEPYYREVGKQLEEIITREGIVDLPQRPMMMRLASEAESASAPAPHFIPAPMIGGGDQQGQFVLPLGNPQSGSGAQQKYDDFNFGAAAWTLSAHEGRPGHELQFSAMLERGVSLARSVFAFNSVNAEGWALYAEAETLPYEPLEGQMIALQFRMLRAARAMLDPMLNLGLIDREAAGRVLRNEVMLSDAMARQELDRYTFGSPGQAGSYFYGYSRLLELRTETELRLGERFDRKAFNNFILDQGLLPPALLAAAVREQFQGKAAAKVSP